jgi:hypothetical protein
MTKNISVRYNSGSFDPVHTSFMLDFVRSIKLQLISSVGSFSSDLSIVQAEPAIKKPRIALQA